jgi:hypothetical protein
MAVGRVVKGEAVRHATSPAFTCATSAPPRVRTCRIDRRDRHCGFWRMTRTRTMASIDDDDIEWIELSA